MRNISIHNFKPLETISCEHHARANPVTWLATLLGRSLMACKYLGAVRFMVPKRAYQARVTSRILPVFRSSNTRYEQHSFFLQDRRAKHGCSEMS